MSARDTQNITSAKFTKTTTATDDRRRRPRLSSEAAGFLLCETASALSEDCREPREVLVQDVSRLGVGFLTSEKMPIGSICRIRIGYGPMRLARRMRVARCELQNERTWRIGAEFA